MNTLNFVLLQCAPQQGQEGGQSPWTMLILFGLIAVVFYLFFIRPQSKRNKDLKKFRENLKRGDKVITAGGVHGRILEIFDNVVVIETEGQGKLKIEKSSIASSVSNDGN